MGWVCEDIYKPALYDATGAEMGFPEPTRRVRMPRFRKAKTTKDQRVESGADRWSVDTWLVRTGALKKRLFLKWFSVVRGPGPGPYGPMWAHKGPYGPIWTQQGPV